MYGKDNFEDLNFRRTINIISPNNFPETFPVHWHKYIEILTAGELPAKNEQSKAIFVINQKEYKLVPGDILFIWPGELHSITLCKHSSITGFQFSSTLLNDLPDFTPYLNFFRSINLLHKKETPELVKNIQSHLIQIAELHNADSMFNGIESIISLYRLFMDFGKYFHKSRIIQSFGKNNVLGITLKKINKVCDFLIENCDQDITLENAASKCELSPCYFSRVFKQATGSTFIEYLTNQRVKKAQILLSDQTLAITDISYQAGFNSISTFNRVFKQLKKCSPSDYRKYYLNS